MRLSLENWDFKYGQNLVGTELVRIVNCLKKCGVT
jgi:hypothetical protein